MQLNFDSSSYNYLLQFLTKPFHGSIPRVHSIPRSAFYILPNQIVAFSHHEYHMDYNFSMTLDHFACDSFNVSVVL